MKARNKIAIFIDYSIRIPNFLQAYKNFKLEIFSDKNTNIDFEDELVKNDVRQFWQLQLQNPEIEMFYFKKELKMPKTDYEVKNLGIESFFYNEEHVSRFLEDYSYNLYVDCLVPNRNDLNIINVAQSQLFDIVLVDEITTKRKVSNTLFFLSKNTVYPQTIIFLDKGQVLNEDNYVAIWNPKKNSEQINADKSDIFLNWFMDLEKKFKDNE